MAKKGQVRENRWDTESESVEKVDECVLVLESILSFNYDDIF